MNSSHITANLRPPIGGVGFVTVEVNLPISIEEFMKQTTYTEILNRIPEKVIEEYCKEKKYSFVQQNEPNVQIIKPIGTVELPSEADIKKNMDASGFITQKFEDGIKLTWKPIPNIDYKAEEKPLQTQTIINFDDL